MRIQIDGNPIPDARSRVTRHGTYNPRYHEKNKLKTYLLSLGLKTLTEPLKVSVAFFMAIPKSTSKKKRKEMLASLITHTKKPDLDNLVKFVFDCCNGILFDDDRQIVLLSAFKCYNISPSTVIDIMPLNVEDRPPFNDIIDVDYF